MLATPNENCDAVDALSRFASDDPTVRSVSPVTKHLEIASEVREAGVRRPVIVDVEAPVMRDVVSRQPVADAPQRPERPVKWVAARQRRPVVKVQVTVAAFVAMVRSDVEKQWLTWRETHPWRAAIAKPSAATMGSAALTMVLAAAILVAIIAPSHSASTGESSSAVAASLREKVPPVVTRRPAPDVVEAAPAVLMSGVYSFTRFMIPALESRPLPLARDRRATQDVVRAPALVAAQPAQPVATSGRAAPPAQRAEVSRAGATFVGSLAIDSEPAGAMVFINQQPVGETPVRLKGISAGSRVVRIEHPGYERWTAAVLVAAEKQAQVIARLQSVRAEQ